MVDITVQDQPVLVITITPPGNPTVVLDPIGVPGVAGGDGWAPILANVADGARSVMRIVDWAGGTSAKPAAGAYIGPTGEVTLITDGVDIRGQQGVPGIQGPAGADGGVIIGGDVDILTGSGAPNDADGIDNQLYLDNISDDVYKKLSGHWTLQTNLKGQQGPAGVKGDTGDTGLQGANGIAGPKGDKGDTGDAGAAGAQGIAGSQIRFGSGAPSNSLGVNGDFYVDQTAFHVYLKVTGAYIDKGSIKGADGAAGTNGTDGSTIHVGAGAPSSGLGNNNDLYFDETAKELYSKSAGAWTDIGSLKGDKGDTGAQGIQGIQGVPGATGPDGAIGPQGVKGDTGSTGAKGDTGDTGPIGSQFLEGSADPTSGVGATTDFYFQTTTKHLWSKESGSWADLGSLKGDQGIQGPDGTAGTAGTNGTNGTNFLAGAGVPSAGTGANGDYYLNETNFDVYGPKTAGAWGSPFGNIKGAAGAAGTPALNVADLLLFFPSTLVANSQVLAKLEIVRAFTWPASLTGSVFKCGTNPAATCVFSILQNGTSKGTLSFSTSGACTVTFASAVTFAVNDELKITGPSTKDTAIADLSFSFLGSR